MMGCVNRVSCDWLEVNIPPYSLETKKKKKKSYSVHLPSGDHKFFYPSLFPRVMSFNQDSSAYEEENQDTKSSASRVKRRSIHYVSLSRDMPGELHKVYLRILIA